MNCRLHQSEKRVYFPIHTSHTPQALEARLTSRPTGTGVDVPARPTAVYVGYTQLKLTLVTRPLSTLVHVDAFAYGGALEQASTMIAVDSGTQHAAEDRTNAAERDRQRYSTLEAHGSIIKDLVNVWANEALTLEAESGDVHMHSTNK